MIEISGPCKNCNKVTRTEKCRSGHIMSYQDEGCEDQAEIDHIICGECGNYNDGNEYGCKLIATNDICINPGAESELRDNGGVFKDTYLSWCCRYVKVV